MNKIFRLKSIALLSAVTLFITSCSSDSNDDIFIDPTDPTAFDGELSVFETGNDNRTVTIDAANVSGTNATVKVSFSASSNTMRRLYVTQNVSGFGAVPYDFAVAGVTVDDKKDGSLDLSSDNGDAFEFAIPFPVPTSADSNIVYTIWATTGRGDFRDISKRNAISDTAIGTITITGSGTSTANGIKTFTSTLLAAPLGDGSSDTFMSVFNNKVYKISEGEETAALWDFGYYYGFTQNASLASTSNYPELFDTNNDNVADAAVSGLTGVAQDELNKFYITTSTIDFDAITSASDLDVITQATTERVTGLSMGDVLEFTDQYGKKGMIKVTNITGTDGNDGSITLDIKVQI
ncbi:hypothetical protein [uncultured Aquimarina sp.]|uniref:hypothetical protein n=1 Tax=uncultured Aquimarina sp. TaxID=575652 RepID=UPI002609482A|nr:hypothetical protein [uncultured Aquimarina sp.]